MLELVERSVEEDRSLDHPLLWWVQIDCNCGMGETDWENDLQYPESLDEALKHAQDLNEKQWITRLVPENLT